VKKIEERVVHTVSEIVLTVLSPPSISLSNELSSLRLGVEFGDLTRYGGWVWVDLIGGKTQSGEI
jgi:hypothetical protein